VDQPAYLTVDDRVPPVRGLVLTQNLLGTPFHLSDVRRWIRLNCDVYKTEKIDLFVQAPVRKDVVCAAVDQADTLNVRLSLRTDCSMPPSALGDIGAWDLLDVFLTPRSTTEENLEAWFDACRTARLPLRFQLQAPFEAAEEPEALTERLAATGAVAVNVALADPFLELSPCRDADHGRRTVDQMNALVAALNRRGVEANLLGLPLCLVTPENLPCAANTQQFFLDHQQYHLSSYDLAVKVFRCRTNAAGKALLVPLGRKTSMTRFVDDKVLPWLLEGARRHLALLVWRKLTRRLRAIRGHPKPLEESVQAYEREIERLRQRRDRKLGPSCSRCRLRRICDHESQDFRRVLPGLGVEPIDGEVAPWAQHFAVKQRKAYDVIDAPRVALGERYAALAEKAMDIVANSVPTREVDSMEYRIDGQWMHQMAGGNRWFAMTDSEKVSTILTRSVPPMTLAVTFGGGIAEYIGFSFGRHCKLLCPMETYSHQVVLHVEADGHYVLLRDGRPVRPVEFEGVYYVPGRLPGVLEPRIAIGNIDESIVTQTVLLWEGAPEPAAALSRVKYSVLIVSTRFARRLQAVLLSLVHQQGVDPSEIEVIICYVPGLDAADDLIDGLHLAHPKLRIVRAPFAESFARSKGFLINEAAAMASGEWVVLMDSDTIVAPNMFAKMDEIADACNFITSDGRIMLTADTTAKILLGEIKPWEQWNELLRGPGEFRLREAKGVPIGFFQCVRRSCLEEVKQTEMDHFEGADWIFGYHMRQKFGREKRLSGVPVLHLDHGGSQWYGTQKHR